MSDTRMLLQKIQAFRQRLDALPRLVAEPIVIAPPKETVSPRNIVERVAAGSRTQAILEQSIRHLSEAESPEPPIPVELSARGHRILSEASELVACMRKLADDPLLAGPPPGQETNETDPLVIWLRETAAMTVPVVRVAQMLPETPSDQVRLCEGLDGILEAVRRRIGVLEGTLAERRREVSQIDRLTQSLVMLNSDQAIDPNGLIELADEIWSESPSHPLHFVTAPIGASQAFLGSTSYPAPARSIACHSLTCARVIARMLRFGSEWNDDPIQPILAALLHDLGMLQVPAEVLALSRPFTDEERRLVEAHPRKGAERVASRLPTFSPIVETIAAHHERLDGTGYPSGLKAHQIPPLARMIAVADFYAALCCPRPYRDARDPRSALTDTLLYAERNILDSFAAEKLLALSFYPVGSVVEMSDGAIGVVAANHVGRAELQLAGRPVINVLIDGHGSVMPSPMPVNLAEVETGSVIRTLSREERARRLGRHYPQWAI